MKTANVVLAATLLCFGVIACQQAAVADNQLAGNAVSPTSDAPPASAAPTGANVADANAADDGPVMNGIHPIPGKPADNIPVAFQGRWGMVPADCTSTRGDAKGLIIIGPDRIRFYESTAILDTIATNDPEHYVGNFNFAGEGQTWSKSEDLKLTGSSNTLTRTDDEGSYKYSRCDQPKV